MKKYLVLSLVLCGTFLLHANDNQYVFPNQFVSIKLQEIIESFRARMPQDAAVLEEDAKKNELIADVSASALGYFVALMIMYNVIERPNGALDAVVKVAYASLGTAVAGTLLGMSFHPVCKFFVMAGVRIAEEMKSPELVHHAALTEFVRHWHEFKPQTPEHLRPCFDELYASYIKNGAMLVIKPDQASKVISDIISACLTDRKNVVKSGVVL